MGLRGTVLLVDWPSRDVPDSLARAGFEVVAQEGPSVFAAYEALGDEVRARPTQQPRRVDVVYAYRPSDEVSEIVELAVRLGARTMYWETGPGQATADEDSRARAIVEGAGLEFRAGRPQPSAL